MESKIELLYTEACHAWKEALVQLKQVLEEAGLKTHIETILINTPQKAKKHKFFGSPTIRINGKDLEKEAEMVTKYGMSACRPYFYQGKATIFHPKK